MIIAPWRSVTRHTINETRTHRGGRSRSVPPLMPSGDAFEGAEVGFGSGRRAFSPVRSRPLYAFMRPSLIGVNHSVVVPSSLRSNDFAVTVVTKMPVRTRVPRETWYFVMAITVRSRLPASRLLPSRGCAAHERDELTPFQPIKLHALPPAGASWHDIHFAEVISGHATRCANRIAGCTAPPRSASGQTTTTPSDRSCQVPPAADISGSPPQFFRIVSWSTRLTFVPSPTVMDKRYAAVQPLPRFRQTFGIAISVTVITDVRRGCR
jgi:hypothetical protein